MAAKYQKMINVFVTPEMAKDLRRASALAGVSASELIREAITAQILPRLQTEEAKAMEAYREDAWGQGG